MTDVGDERLFSGDPSRRYRHAGATLESTEP